MSDFSKKISKIAQSDMSRDALNHWQKFKLPVPNKDIDELLAKLTSAKRSSMNEKQ